MKPRPLIGVAPVASGLLDGRAGRITFWSFTEATGAATAEVRLFDATSAGGVAIADITLQAGQSTRDSFNVHAIPYETALFLQVVSGSVNGQVYSLPEEECCDGAMPVLLVNVDDLNLFGQQ